MAVVYRHIRLDKNVPFYIGIGDIKKRAYDKRKRNAYWNYIVSKSEYRVDILLDDLTYEQAKEKEIEFIKLYGRKDLGLGTLSNMTDGGDGTVGLKMSDEANKKRSDKQKNKFVSNETKEKISKSLQGHKVSEKSLQKLSERNKKPITDEQRKNMSLAQIKRYSSTEKKQYIKIGRNHKGGKNPRAKSVIDDITGIVYETIKEAANKLNMNYSHLKCMLNGIRKNKTSLRYV
jgi:hypothetical protein